MTKVALKGLLGRRTRAILTSLAVVLGVAMISGTFVLTDTIQKSFDGVFQQAYSKTDAMISAKEIVKNSRNRAPVPEALLGKVRALDETAAATGDVNGEVKLIDSKGKTVGGANTEGEGFSVDPKESRFSPLTLVQGHWAAGPHEIVIDSHTATAHHYAVGDTIGAKAEGPVRQYTISGIGKLSGDGFGGLVTLAAFDLRTAQDILDRRGEFDSISVAADKGVSQQQLKRAIQPLAGRSLEVQTSDEAVKQASDDLSKGIGTIRVFLLAFGAISLFVGAFVIFNTISITVAQRTRELATLRTLGASRRQVLRSVMVETLAIGLVASAIGLVAGVGIAAGLKELFAALGVELPKASAVIASRTVIVSMLVGTVVTLLAGLLPAVRATAVPPISAVREGATLPRSRFARLKPYAAAVVTVLGLGLIAVGMSAGGSASSILASLGAGTLLLFTGVAMMSSHLVKPLARVVGIPARRLGGSAGKLATQNSVRNPARTASTAAALMIGLALVTFVATLGSGLKDSVISQIKDQAKSDYVVTSSTNEGTFPKAADRALAGAPGVKVASSVRADKARVLGEETSVVGVDPATIASVYHFDWKHGSDAAVTSLGDGAILDSKYAEDNHLRVGSRLRVQTPAGEFHSYVVKATYDAPKVQPLFTGVVISQQTFDRDFPQAKNAMAFASGGTLAGVKHALAGFPDARVETKAAYVDRMGADVNTSLAMFYVLLALSVIVSLFGMVNTMILSVYERTRELGMLRAIGMTRRQARRMVRHESVITALIGAGLGLPLGVLLAAIATRGLSSEGIGFHLSIAPLIAFTVVAVVAGVLAAIPPARRASRLNVLSALQYE